MNKGVNSKFQECYQVQRWTPEEGYRVQRLKPCKYMNQEDCIGSDSKAYDKDNLLLVLISKQYQYFVTSYITNINKYGNIDKSNCAIFG